MRFPSLPTTMTRSLVLLVVLLGALAVLAACGGDDAPASDVDNPDRGNGDNGQTEDPTGDNGEGDNGDGTPETPTWTAGIINPPFELPDLVLTDQNGNEFDIVEQSQGKVTLFYLGYTNCPDICPTHVATLTAALDRVDPEVREQVQFIFATADPARDTPEVLDNYLSQWDEDYIGLTGTEEEIQELHQALGVPPSELGVEDPDGNYEVAHLAFVIGYSPDGEGYLAFPSGMSVEQWARDLTRYVTEGPPDQEGA